MQLFTAIDCMDHIVEILTCVGAAAGMQFVTQRVLGGMYPVLLAKQAGCQDRAAAVKTLTAGMCLTCGCITLVCVSGFSLAFAPKW